MPRPLITLTTDFGERDYFVGAVKGVILSINPEVRIVDITHGISPGDIRSAAFIVKEIQGTYPRGTIHFAVVDPGVGSSRRALAIKTEQYYIGPDNGLFTYVLAGAKAEIHEINAQHYFLKPNSPTFAARDLFAPVAAWISKGVELRHLGAEIPDPVFLPVAEPRVALESIEGEVVYIDRFGNLITNIAKPHLSRFLPPSAQNFPEVQFRGSNYKMQKFYRQAAPGEIGAILNSSDRLEIFASGASAQEILGAKLGESVKIIGL